MSDDDEETPTRCACCGIAPLGGPYDDDDHCGECAREIAAIERDHRAGRWE